MNNKDILKLAAEFEQSSQPPEANGDLALIDSIYNGVLAAQQILTGSASQASRFLSELKPLVDAKASWGKMSPQQKYALIKNVFEKYQDLPQSYMNPNYFRPIPLRDNISGLFSKLIGKYRY